MDISSLKESLPVAVDPADRLKELKAFEDSKAGVKGIVDTGIEKVPRMFIRPSDDLAQERNYGSLPDFQLPIIDLGGERQTIVSELKRASKEYGIFYVVNHGIGLDVLDGVVDGIKRFHEQDLMLKQQYVDTEKVKFGSNVDLYKSKAANWRDTLTISHSELSPIQSHHLPQICRDSTITYVYQVTKLGDTMFELLSEALGQKSDHLGRVLECGHDRIFVCHYYPACPEPELTMGISKHTDPSFITILLQDHIGGLQILRDNHFIDVKPIPGSLVVSIGDMLHIVSNSEFVSPDHRVVAKKLGPRISVVGFFNGTKVDGKVYGPIEDLVSEKNGTRYRNFKVQDYISKFMQRSLDKSGLGDFRLEKNNNATS